MKTKIIKIDIENIDLNMVNEAASLLKNGELVAIPTETVYGLAADGLNNEACLKIFKAKQRPSDNPLILHISHTNMLYNLTKEVGNQAKKLFDLWPGPLTMIFKKSDIIPDAVTCGGNTVAIRMPSDKIARAIISRANTPLAAPSANLSGKPSPTNAMDVYADMNGTIPLIVDGGESDIGIESTVIDFSEGTPTILRPGYYTYEYLQTILPNIVLDDSLVDSTALPKSPGQKYKHYAPKANLRVFIGENVPAYILKLAEKYKEEGKKVGILAFEEDKDKFKTYPYISLGLRKDLSTMSHVLFSSLREMDRLRVDIILAEGVRENHLGKSIMNRMKKAAANDVNYLK